MMDDESIPITAKRVSRSAIILSLSLTQYPTLIPNLKVYGKGGN
jgi:hypothetical protein